MSLQQGYPARTNHLSLHKGIEQISIKNKFFCHGNSSIAYSQSLQQKKRKTLNSKPWNANIGITVTYNKIAPNWILSGQISYPFTKKKKEKLLIRNEKKIKKMA